MKISDLFLTEEGDPDFDYDDWDHDNDDGPTKKILLPAQQRALDRHTQKQARNAFRQQERKRREKEEELFDPEYPGQEGTRHVPKSVVQYKPFAWPMIRFGKFGHRSRVGFDAEMRREMGNKNFEEGVSCFKAVAYQDGYVIREHQGRPSWNGHYEENKMLLPWLRQLHPQFERWRKDGALMDIFVLRGHLKSFGKNQEWLSVGSDGEYLMDMDKPHYVVHVDPEKLWINERLALIDFYRAEPVPYQHDNQEE